MSLFSFNIKKVILFLSLFAINATTAYLDTAAAEAAASVTGLTGIKYEGYYADNYTLNPLNLISNNSALINIDFGTVADFMLFTGVGAVQNTGVSTITGNIGSNAGAIAGFGAPSVLNGVIENSNAVTAQAYEDLKAACLQLQGLTATITDHSAVFGSPVGETIYPGVYTVGSAASISGTLILDAQGDPDAMFIFKITGALDSVADTTVLLANEASSANVYWIAYGAVGFGANTTMIGTAIAYPGAVSLGANGSITGSLYTTTGDIATDSFEAAISTSGSTQHLTKHGKISIASVDLVNKYGALGGSSGLTANGKRITSAPDGLTSATASTSAYQIKQDFPSSVDGVYWIDVPGYGPKQTYCLMDSAYNGGGWMLALKATTGTTFNYGATYWTTANTVNPNDVTRNNADAKYDVMNGFSAKDMMALWPDIPNVAAESGSIDGLTQWSWLQNNFNTGTTITPISFFSTANNSFVSDADLFSGKGTAFSGQTQVRFYGFNYTVNTNAKVRWGFAWNENSTGLFPNGNQSSNDVSGGIGMESPFGNYSAGDRINCCQNTTGINRSARVEIYIR